MKYQIAEETLGTPFYNYCLTDLMLLKKNGRNKSIANNMGVHLILQEYLQSYGIVLNGGTTAVNDKNLKFRAVWLSLDFPVENEFILNQLYGYDDLEIDIQLAGFPECSYSFIYNTTKKTCRLCRHVHYSTTHTKEYETLSDMLQELNEKGYEAALGLEYVERNEEEDE